MKKIVLSVAVVLVLIGTYSPTVLGGWGHGSGNKIAHENKLCTQGYMQCGITDCSAIGPHLHNDAWYCNQPGLNCGSYEVCTVEGCIEIGLHEHDGTMYHCALYPNGCEKQLQKGNCGEQQLRSGSGCGRNCK